MPLSFPAHRRVFACFFLYAFGLGGMFPRLGELQRSMAISEGQLGLGLVGAACGTLFSLSFAGPTIERIGHRRTLLTLLPLLPLFYALASHAAGPVTLFLGLLPAGLCIGAIEVVVNLEADRVEHEIGRRIMNRAHAFWSFGFFSAGLLGSLAARAGLSPQWHLALAVPLAAAATWWLVGGFEAAPQRHAAQPEPAALSAPTERPARFVRPTAAILMLVALTLSAQVLEGAGFDWSAIYMRDAFAAPAWVGGLAVAVGACAQGLARYFADTHVERHSPVAVARTLLAVLGVGDLLAVAAPNLTDLPAVPLLGFALMGVGTSALFPLAMSAAAQRSDRPAAANVAALAQISFVSFLLAPPLLGQVAQHLGIRWAFGVGLPLVALSLAVSSVLVPQAAPRSRRET